MNTKTIAAFAFALFITGVQASALDIYSLIDSSCKVHSGLIVGADDQLIKIINLKGEFDEIERSKINTIVIFNSLENSIPELKIDKKLAELTKDFYVHEESKPLFTGWPVRFVEDLVIFYDTSGKSHVLDLADVTKIRDVEIPERTQSFKNRAEKISLNFNDVNSQCSNLNENGKDGTGPTRIIDDKINVSEFLSNFEKGFQKIESYEQRTYFYSRPFLFEKRSKLGIVVFNNYQENAPVLPMYFQWATGKPYGFQTFNVFGSSPVEWVPLAEPSFVFRSDVKSHFFNATFVGNIAALPAGSSYFTNLSIKLPRDTFAAHQYNYLTLLGADYGAFTLSFGTFFPIFDFQVKGTNTTEGREVLANAVSPAIRLMYSKGPLTLRFIYSTTQESGSGSDNSGLRLTSALTTAPDNYNVTSYYVRGGIDYAFTKELKGGLDEIYSLANYTENFGLNQYFFNSTYLTTSAYFLQSFGYYISVKVYANMFNENFNYKFVNGTDSPSAIYTSLGGAFEFDF